MKRQTRKQRLTRRRRLLTKRRRGGNIRSYLRGLYNPARSPVSSTGSTSSTSSNAGFESPVSPKYVEKVPLCPKQFFNSQTPNSFGKTEKEVFDKIKTMIDKETWLLPAEEKKEYIEQTIQRILYDSSYFTKSVGHVIRDSLKEKIANELCNMMLKGTEQKQYRIKYNN